MENIPVLYLDLTTCKQGLGDRQPSIEWAEPDQVHKNTAGAQILNIQILNTFEYQMS